MEPLNLTPEHVALVKRAMHGVTIEGTSARVFAGAGYSSGGKTGTAQAVTIRQNEKYNASKLAEHLRDHSLYIAFAPLDKPQIALAVIVENAGFGAQAAAPIARRVFDYVVMGKTPSAAEISASGGTPGDPIATESEAAAPAAPASAPTPASSAPAIQAGLAAGKARLR
jgi:penicillin-binding protein 2